MRSTRARQIALAVAASALLGACSAASPQAEGSASSGEGPAMTHPPSPTATPTPSASPSPTTPDDGLTSCARQTRDALTDDQALGQLFMVALHEGSAASSLDPLVTEQHAGNMLFLGGWYDGAAAVSEVTAHLASLTTAQATAGVGMLIAVDQEGGQVQQLRGDGFTRMPSALTQATQTPAELVRNAQAWGEQLAAVGVNVNLAPVADTVSPELGRANQPIGRWKRQYGSDPEVVSTYAAAFAQGMRQAGLATTAKHFPGLGRITGNTDFTTAGITDRVTTPDDPYLQPFHDQVTAATPLVMLSLATYAKIDPDHPAALSPSVVGILRHTWGYTGVVISDDLNAVAVRAIPAGDRATSFVAAGGDLIIISDSSQLAPMVQALRTASTDPTFAAQVRASLARILSLKDALGLLPCSAR